MASINGQGRLAAPSLQLLALVKVAEAGGASHLPLRLREILQGLASIPLSSLRKLPVSSIQEKVLILLTSSETDPNKLIRAFLFMIEGASPEELKSLRSILLKKTREEGGAKALYLSYSLHQLEEPFSSEEWTLWIRGFRSAIGFSHHKWLSQLLAVGVDIPYRPDLVQVMLSEDLPWAIALWPEMTSQDLARYFVYLLDNPRNSRYTFDDVCCAFFCLRGYKKRKVISVLQSEDDLKALEEGLAQELLHTFSKDLERRGESFVALCRYLVLSKREWLLAGHDSVLPRLPPYAERGWGIPYNLVSLYLDSGRNPYELRNLVEYCRKNHDPFLASILNEVSLQENFWNHLLRIYIKNKVQGICPDFTILQALEKQSSEALYSFLKGLPKQYLESLLVVKSESIRMKILQILGEIPDNIDVEVVRTMIMVQKLPTLVCQWIKKNCKKLLFRASLKDFERLVNWATEDVRFALLYSAQELRGAFHEERLDAALFFYKRTRSDADRRVLCREIQELSHVIVRWFMEQDWDFYSPLISGYQRRAFLWEALWNGEWALAWRLFRSFFV